MKPKQSVTVIEENPLANQKAGGGLCCADLLECVVVSIEYKWFCVRNPAGWLLYSTKLAEMPPQGIALADIAEELKAKQAEWQRDHDEMEAAEHSND